VPSSYPVTNRCPVFIVSTGRSGSQMLARVLALSPAIGAFHEPRPLLNTEAYLVWSGRAPWHPGSVTESVRYKRSWLIEEIQDHNGLIYVESSHFASHLIPVLDRLWGAKFVHLVRNGRDVVRSGLRRSTWYGKISLKARVAAWLRRRLPLAEVGDTFLDHRLDPPRECRTRVARIAWLWAEVNRVCLRNLATIPPERQMRLHVEALGPTTLTALLQFIGADPEPALIARMLALADTRPNASPHDSQAEAPTWRAEEEEQFRAFAGSMMQQMGYE